MPEAFEYGNVVMNLFLDLFYRNLGVFHIRFCFLVSKTVAGGERLGITKSEALWSGLTARAPERMTPF